MAAEAGRAGRVSRPRADAKTGGCAWRRGDAYAVQKNTKDDNDNDKRGGIRNSVPAINLDTLRGGRKEEPQH